MKEVKKNKFESSLDRKMNIKMSNMDMKIILNQNSKPKKIKDSLMLSKNNIQKVILPSFTKKIINTVSKNQ